ncbi:MAG TPA: hypothetical protein VI911_07650 [Patescibacteria group bacterium]|nr:hypothetical protein [Patescibacteria group bacterium]
MQKSNTKKIKCNTCKNLNEAGTRCLIKKDKVKSNKHRFCLHYQLDITKVVIKPRPVSTYAPIWVIDGAIRRKRLKALTKLHEQQVASSAVGETTKNTYLVEEPIVAPDCLANIRSTAVDPDEVIS